MRCQVCARDNEERSMFCGFCGNPLTEITPHTTTSYGIVSFPDAIKLGFQRYFDFRGRSTRAEYWWWALFTIITQAVLNVFPPAGLLFTLATLIPGLALGARRLHDIDRSGWWQLMWLGVFVIVPWIILWWWAAKPTREGSNKHGADPRIELFG